MNIDPDGGTLGLHAMVNPMVAWIWVAAAVMALGGLVALVPARRVRRTPRSSRPSRPRRWRPGDDRRRGKRDGRTGARPHEPPRARGRPAWS